MLRPRPTPLLLRMGGLLGAFVLLIWARSARRVGAASSMQLQRRQHLGAPKASRPLQLTRGKSTIPGRISSPGASIHRAERVLEQHPELLTIWSGAAGSRYVGVSSAKSSQEVEVDLFRETLLRYLGYANEVGEAFRAFIGPSGVLAGYAVASGYVVSDSIYQGYKMHKKQEGQISSDDVKRMRVTVAALESLLWQSLASVAIPGFTINRSVALAHYALDHLYKSPIWNSVPADTTEKIDHWGPTLFGLAMIPIIVRPIDSTVEHLREICTTGDTKIPRGL